MFKKGKKRLWQVFWGFAFNHQIYSSLSMPLKLYAFVAHLTLTLLFGFTFTPHDTVTISIAQPKYVKNRSRKRKYTACPSNTYDTANRSDQKKTIIINKNDNNAKADLKRSLANKTPFIGFINWQKGLDGPLALWTDRVIHLNTFNRLDNFFEK